VTLTPFLLRDLPNLGSVCFVAKKPDTEQCVQLTWPAHVDNVEDWQPACVCIQKRTPCWSLGTKHTVSAGRLEPLCSGGALFQFHPKHRLFWYFLCFPHNCDAKADTVTEPQNNAIFSSLFFFIYKFVVNLPIVLRLLTLRWFSEPNAVQQHFL
jgi:hypothetical protein